MHVAYKKYKRSFRSSCCRRSGDGFFDAKPTCYSFLNYFPTRIEDERRLLPGAFEKDTVKVFGYVASSNYTAAADQLWTLLEASLCNKAQLHVLQDKVFGLKWNDRKGSVAAFGERLRWVSLALQTPVADENLLSRFKATLRSMLQDQAMLVTGHFYNAVSVVSRQSSPQQNNFTEKIQEVQ